MRQKICMLAVRCFPDYGGAALQALRLGTALAKYGHKVIFAGRQKDSGIGSVFGVHRQQHHEVIVYRLSAPRRPIRFCSLIFNVKAFLLLVITIRQYKIIHVHGMGSPFHGIVGLVAAKVLRKKILCKMTTFGLDDPETISRRKFGKIKLLPFQYSDKIISISNELSRSYRKVGLGENKLLEIPNGVDTQIFRPVNRQYKRILRNQLGLWMDNEICCYVGIVDERKGIDLLLEAVEMIIAQHSNICLLLVGPVDNGFYRRYSERIERAAESGHLKMVGMVDNVDSYYKASDLFVLPSRREGLPNALLEAMACGLPCIASNLECNRDVIRSGRNGLIFSENDCDDLVSKMKAVLSGAVDKSMLIREGLLTINEKYAFDVVARRYISVYESLC